MSKAQVVGLGVIAVAKPGASASCDVMASPAGRLALRRRGVGCGALQQACRGDVSGDSASGRRAPYALRMTAVSGFNLKHRMRGRAGPHEPVCLNPAPTHLRWR